MSMRLVDKLKQFEKQVVFLRWGASAEYGKLQYIGLDFVQFQVLNVELMEYAETIIINPQLILEIVVGSSDIGRIVAEYSRRLPSL